MTADAIPAATLIVMRERADQGPPELLMVTRAAGMAFAGGAMVFPGGRVDRADAALGGGLDDGAFRVAAIRETVEESGVAAGLAPEPDHATTLALQDALHDGQDFADLLDRHELALDLGALTPFARWKPAFRHARIFDTLFFLAPAPPGDEPPRHQPGECEAVEWLSAADVLAKIERRAASAIFPTKRNLERLARFTSLTEAIADAQAHPIVTITPWIEDRHGEPHVVIPENAGYPVTAEPLATAFRA